MLPKESSKVVGSYDMPERGLVRLLPLRRSFKDQVYE